MYCEDLPKNNYGKILKTELHVQIDLTFSPIMNLPTRTLGGQKRI